MRLGTVAWGLALLLVANLPSAGLSAERETAATPKQEAGRVIPANVERAALEGTIEEVDRKAGTFVMNAPRTACGRSWRRRRSSAATLR
jgi:hypothetical protein